MNPMRVVNMTEAAELCTPGRRILWQGADEEQYEAIMVKPIGLAHYLVRQTKDGNTCEIYVESIRGIWEGPCDHIVGIAWVLNDEEGDAYIRKFIKRGMIPELDWCDWTLQFMNCPLCGEALELIDDVEVLT